MNNEYKALFVYGTLLNASTQKYIIGREVKGKTAFISSWEKQKIHPSSTIFMARYNPNTQIAGKVLLLTDYELMSCDGFESEGTLYQRRTVVTQSGIETFIYTELDKSLAYRMGYDYDY